MRILFDCHVHTRRSPCGHAEASVADLAPRVAAAGIPRWGTADHLFTACNVVDLESGRAEYDALADRSNVCFAVEVSVLRDWDIAETARDKNVWGWRPGGPPGELALYLPPELCARLGFQYVIAGAHWPLGAPMRRDAIVRDYHRQNMFLATHPQVDIIAHPWWWRTTYIMPCLLPLPFRWQDDFSIIPQSMHDEFAAAVREHGKRVELNAATILKPKYSARWHEQYLEFLVRLRESGCRFVVGSDSHSAEYAAPHAIVPILEKAGFTQDDLWSGPEEPPERT
jgi:histidinol phosphatase-like PHP family hydrolase